MTKEEILALIDAKIAGQGTNIDAGSALPEILSGILGLIPDSIPERRLIYAQGELANFEDETIQDGLEILGIDMNDFIALTNPNIDAVLVGENEGGSGYFLTRTTLSNPYERFGSVTFGGPSGLSEQYTIVLIHYNFDTDKMSCSVSWG